MKHALGIDPGMRRTGITLVRSSGPGRPELVHAETVRPNAGGGLGSDTADAMLVDVVRAAGRIIHPVAADGPVVGIETFAFRPYLATKDGAPRRVNTGSSMGRLVGRLLDHLAMLGLQCLEVDPEESKGGWPNEQRILRNLLPAGLHNVHERDAYLAAAWALTNARWAR